MLADWEHQYPNRVESIFSSLQSVAPSQLADQDLFNFADLAIDRNGERTAYDYDEEESSPVQLVEAVQVP